jgi:cysteine synthase A
VNIHSDVSELVGNTPLVLLRSFSTHARIVGKLEYLNPGGSAKDRVARSILDAAARDGALARGQRVLEKCGANTAVSLSWMAACRGYRLDLVMPEDTAEIQVGLCRSLGAQVHLTAPAHVAELWRQRQTQIDDAYLPDQFANPLNAQAHQVTTAPEIWRDTDGEVDAVVAGIGTGGTLAGLSRFLKPLKPSCAVIGVEPREAPAFSQGRHAPHGIPGLGIPVRPVQLRPEDLDEVILVDSGTAVQTARQLARCEGVLAGVSSGAVLRAAVDYAARPANANKLIVIILCDGSRPYHELLTHG